jgi:hypothetical protein
MAFIVHVPGLGHYCIEGTPGDPSSAKLVVAPPELVAEEERWRNLPIVLPSVPRVPEGPPCPVELGEEGVSAKILGRDVTAPSGVAWRALRVLVGVFPAGVTGKELNEAAMAANACHALLKLTHLDSRWSRVLVFPLRSRGAERGAMHYAIREPAPRSGSAGTSYKIHATG